MLIEHVRYQAQVKATGGRERRAVSFDGVLEVQLTTPPHPQGRWRRGTNPGAVVAAAYAASFLECHAGTSLHVTPSRSAGDLGGGHGRGRRHPQGSASRSSCGLRSGAVSPRGGGTSRRPVVCPYSNATRGNIADAVGARVLHA
jgi:hypothetical protein